MGILSASMTTSSKTIRKSVALHKKGAKESPCGTDKQICRPSFWDESFDKLSSFKERFGHCNVGQGWKEDAGLGTWASMQRSRRKNGTLPAEQIARLEGLGFVWNWLAQKTQATWMKWYGELAAYAKEHGNPNIPRTHANSKLASWVWIQRIRRDRAYSKAPRLTEEQIALLDKLGFQWDPHEDRWESRFWQLMQFKELHGHCDVGATPDADEDLRKWCEMQRIRLSQGLLISNRKAKLEEIGFDWNCQGRWRRMWDGMYEKLKVKLANPAGSLWKNDRKLEAWVFVQRKRRKDDSLSADQVRLLDEIGFTWQMRERGRWEDRYKELLAFKSEHGHCNVPLAYPPNRKLGGFVNAMRSSKSSGRLRPRRIALLEEAGFLWSVQEQNSAEAWDARYGQLVAFQAEHGHCNVPFAWTQNPELARWVSSQRQRKKKGQCTPEQESRLDALGFDWNPRAGKRDMVPC